LKKRLDIGSDFRFIFYLRSTNNPGEIDVPSNTKCTFLVKNHFHLNWSPSEIKGAEKFFKFTGMMDREVEFYDKPSAFEKLPGWVERWSGVSQ